MECDLGSVNAPPPLEHRDSGVGWSKLQASSFKLQASSFKLQAASNA